MRVVLSCFSQACVACGIKISQYPVNLTMPGDGQQPGVYHSVSAAAQYTPPTQHAFRLVQRGSELGRRLSRQGGGRGASPVSAHARTRSVTRHDSYSLVLVNEV